MLDALVIITQCAVLITGVVVLKLGKWEPHALKFAAVAMSTTGAALYLLYMFVKLEYYTCTGDICEVANGYRIVINSALVMFHLAVGRDATQFKRGDRRGYATRSNSF